MRLGLDLEQLRCNTVYMEDIEETDTDFIILNGDREECLTVRKEGKGVTLSSGNREWVVFETREEAGEDARAYWKDMAENDPSEFTCIVGETSLVAWGLGQYASPGTTQVKSLEEWLDLWLDVPEEHFASYDGHEIDSIEIGAELKEEIGFTPEVAYRRN